LPIRLNSKNKILIFIIRIGVASFNKAKYLVMKTFLNRISIIIAGGLWLFSSCQKSNNHSVTVPMFLDHNRMLIDAEMQKSDGSWRKVRLWIDPGNPTFSLSEKLARDIGLDLSVADDPEFKGARLAVPPPAGLRIGDFYLNTDSVNTIVMFQPFWFFTTMHNDANLPSSILRKYHIVFDYPKGEFTVALPNSTKPKGTESKASIHPETGIVQMDAFLDGDSLSFALDVGASYSFISEEKLLKFSARNPSWPNITGTLGCANMWGWWPANEQQFPVVRIPQIQWGNEVFTDIGFAGVTKFSPDGPTLGEWYSRKTAKPVDGFIGPNALKGYRVEIDYANSLVYFEKGKENDPTEMDIVGLSVRQLPDSTYQVVGLVQKNGKPCVDNIEPEDIIVSIDGFQTKGATMGTVVDKLRGKPGDLREIVIDRKGKEVVVKAKVEHFL